MYVPNDDKQNYKTKFCRFIEKARHGKYELTNKDLLKVPNVFNTINEIKCLLNFGYQYNLIKMAPPFLENKDLTYIQFGYFEIFGNFEGKQTQS